MIEPIKPSVWRSASRKIDLNVSAVRIAGGAAARPAGGARGGWGREVRRGVAVGECHLIAATGAAQSEHQILLHGQPREHRSVLGDQAERLASFLGLRRVRINAVKDFMEIVNKLLGFRRERVGSF